MIEHCQNCRTAIRDQFCEHCGQKKYKRIDKKYIWDELQYTLLHANKGLLYSIKKTLINPGKTAKEFVDGNRVNHYKPILMTFVLSGLSSLISFKILKVPEIVTAQLSQQNVDTGQLSTFMSFIVSYNAIIMLIMIPLFAITTKIAFSKWGHNYYEHVVMNAYILSTYTLLTIILVYPIMFVFRHNLEIFMLITRLSIILVPAILIWFFKGFYPAKPMKSILLKVLATLGITFLGYMLLIFILSILMFVIFAS